MLLVSQLKEYDYQANYTKLDYLSNSFIFVVFYALSVLWNPQICLIY
jgi:hypothetical protein